MTLRLRPYGLSGCLAVIALAACSSGSQNVASKYVASAVIGPEGGTIPVTTADDATLAGTSIVVPKGALSASTTISIGLSAQAVAQKGQTARGPVVDFEPSGTEFLVPVTIIIPTTATSATSLSVEAVEGDGSVKALAVSSVASGLVTFKATGFTQFGAVSSSSTSCSTDTDCASGTVCLDGVCASPGATCAAGETECGGTCVDLASDPSNCGACGSACAAGATCGSGVCATTITTVDGGAACSTDSDCPAGSDCVSGECVTSVIVADACAPATCASLGLTCGSTSDGCGGTLNCGTCADDGGVDATSDATTCAAGQTDCSGICVDLTSDSANCGTCGAVCAAGTTCSEGACGA